MSYKIAGIDVHKKMLAVVVADVSGSGEYEFERHTFGTQPSELEALAAWTVEQAIEEVVMESTAQYWRPVWHALERSWQPECRKREGAGPASGSLHLAQAESNRARPGRKNDFDDAERLVRRLVADELILSFVPPPEQRLWRAVSRRKYQLTQDRARLRNQLEGLLEEAQIKLTSLVSDLFGASGRRMLKGLSKGETEVGKLAALADHRLRASQEQLRDALGACTNLDPVYRELLKQALAELELMDKHIEELGQQMSSLLAAHQDAVKRLADVPGLGVDSAQQIIAQVGTGAETFGSAKELASWVGVCPGKEETAGKSHSDRCPKGNRTLRRVLDQSANAAIRVQGSIFQISYSRVVPRLGHEKAIWAIAHRLCRLTWLVLHRGVRYEERGPNVSEKSQKARAARMIRELRKLGYQVEPIQRAAGGAR